MDTEDTISLPPLPSKDEKEAQKVPDHPQKNGTLKATQKWTGLQGRTLWDWLQLLGVLAIPLVVVGATIGFGGWQVHLADLQHESDQIRALDQQQAAILQTYIDNIQDLLLHEKLRESKQGDEVAILARARTLTALQGLDPKRKGRLLIFLHEAELIGFPDNNNLNKTHDPIINLRNADLRGADLSFADLSGADLSKATLRDADLSRADLSKATLRGVNLEGAILREADLRGTDLNGADLLEASLIKAHLTNADLSGALLFLADLSSADLSGADLYGDDLSFAHLREANLSSAHLNGADLSSTDLSFAHLNGADLSGADLNGADLNGANLTNANLSSTYLGSANLSGANLSGANLSGAQILAQEQLDQVSSCKGAFLPKGLICHRNQ